MVRRKPPPKAQITDKQLRRTHTQKVDWAALEPEERRLFLQELNEPPELKLRVPGKAQLGAKKRARPTTLHRREVDHPDPDGAPKQRLT